ncbi:hypothetical protein [Mesobacillus maritimus]|uniref:Tyr recombinase domain-containing protein n=1 Tax=Mesobacillus maritimus TaxID=1643336 RepID=A0ABS7K8V1_9BACI|nr:hypothetical protein [Mesobacillus maritimus]MBY0098691.1 hypothetical protein [Mesobacillus maritimus]
MENLTLLTRNQAAKLSGISGKCFNYLVQQTPFVQYLVKDESNYFVQPEAIPLIQEYYSEHNEAYHFYNNSPEYIAAYHVARMLNLSFRELVEQIRRGNWEGKYVEIPKCAPPPPDLLDIRMNYFFIRSAVLENRFNTIEQIGKNTNLVSLSQLRQYQRAGLLPQPAHLLGTNLYDETEIITLLPSLKVQVKESFSEFVGENLKSAFDLLNQKQQELLRKYLRFRENGGVIDYNGYRSAPQIANKDEMIEVMKRTISSAFVLIIAGRCGIEDDFHKNPFQRIQLPDGFNPDVFDIYKVTKDDYLFLSTKRKGKTLINYYQQLRPFYYYLLDSMEEDAMDDEDEFRKFTRIKRRIMKFLQQFPRKDSELNKADVNTRTKTFLTREQMVLIKHYLLEDLRARDPLKNATMWQLSCTTGIRPEELHKLKIEHFQLDYDGYLKTDEKGWGILRLPASISKQENSPSHPDYHTPIPPDTVKQLNQFLSFIYRKQDQSFPKGKGFLFRPDYALPEYQYKKPMTFGFINRLRQQLDFLDDVRKQDFIFKASRHSLNNIIMRTFIRDDISLNDLAKRTAADHQLRHKPTRSVGEEYYLSEISKEQYYQVLDATINFPWDLEKLKVWEEERGYRVGTMILEVESFTDNLDEENPERNDLQEQLLKIDSELIQIQQKPKGMTEQQWISKRQSLIASKKKIITTLKGV